MTINELLAAAGLNGTDELPIWNGATQKVTAQQLANAVKTLANLQGQLTFDNTPTVGSSNPVTSDGINTAIQQSTANKVRWFNFGGLDTSQTIRAALNELGTRETATVYMTSGMMGIVSGGKVTNRATFGTVVKSSDDEDIFTLTSTDGLYSYGFGASATNAAQFTVSNVYRVTGTAI